MCGWNASFMPTGRMLAAVNSKCPTALVPALSSSWALALSSTPNISSERLTAFTASPPHHRTGATVVQSAREATRLVASPQAGPLLRASWLPHHDAARVARHHLHRNLQHLLHFGKLLGAEDSPGVAIGLPGARECGEIRDVVPRRPPDRLGEV